MTNQTLVSQIHKTSHVLVLVVPFYFFIDKSEKKKLQFTNTETGPQKPQLQSGWETQHTS